MKILQYFKTNKVLRAKIAGLEARLHDQEDKTHAAHDKHRAATAVCRRMALKIQECNTRSKQLHNAADNLATQLEKSGQCAAGHREGTIAIERARALAHWRSIR